MNIKFSIEAVECIYLIYEAGTQMVAAQDIQHVEYAGLMGLIPSTDPGQIIGSFPGFDTLITCSSNLFLSNDQLIRYKSNEYLLLIDGIIYDFVHNPVNGDQYPKIIDQLVLDPGSALGDLHGEFTILLAKRTEGSFLVGNSRAGNSAFFYGFVQGGLLFSNSLSRLASSHALSGKVNYQRIYDILAARNLGAEETCYSQIRRLLPGSFLEVPAGGEISAGDQLRGSGNGDSAAGGPKVTKYASYAARLDRPEARMKEKEIFEAFRERFRESVRIRMGSNKTGIALSAGKDSTAVAAMSASETGGDRELFGYTYVPAHLPRELLKDHRYNESLLLNTLYDRYPTINRREIELESSSILSSLESALEIYGEPVYGASNQFWIQEVHSRMLVDGCKILLTGQGGNYTISWPPPELVSGKKRSMKQVARDLLGLKRQVSELPYLAEGFLKEVDRSRDPIRKLNSRLIDLQPLLINNSIAYTGQLQKQVSLYHGIHVSDPAFDHRLIEFCLSLPERVYHDRQKSRKLITVGMSDLLPPEIINNPVRGMQSSDLQYRLEAEREVVLEKLLFCNTNKIVTFVLNLEKLIRDWKSLDFLTLKKKELNHLTRVLLTILFLSKLGD